MVKMPDCIHFREDGSNANAGVTPRDVKGLFVGWAINQTYNISWNQLKEFTPDLGAFLKRRSERKRYRKEIHDAGCSK